MSGHRGESKDPASVGMSRQEVPVERVELSRIAGKMLGSIDYLRLACRLRWEEGTDHFRLATKLADLVWARERIIALVEALPEGPLEAFAREHPLYHDAIDGPYCGYGHLNGTPYKCPVKDPALHWDAWEMMGTTHKRPATAIRGGDRG